MVFGAAAAAEAAAAAGCLLQRRRLSAAAPPASAGAGAAAADAIAFDVAVAPELVGSASAAHPMAVAPQGEAAVPVTATAIVAAAAPSAGAREGEAAGLVTPTGIASDAAATATATALRHHDDVGCKARHIAQTRSLPPNKSWVVGTARCPSQQLRGHSNRCSTQTCRHGCRKPIGVSTMMRLKSHGDEREISRERGITKTR